jgi:hypothetical protein
MSRGAIRPLLACSTRAACLAALEIPCGTARAHTLTFTWAKSARQFLDNILLAKSSAGVVMSGWRPLIKGYFAVAR